MKGKRVLVGLSGGVDSSVAALRLIAEGYEVIGAFIRVWHPPFITCSEAEDRLDAMRVAATLRIPFITIDARKEYEEHVAGAMIREYKAGRTPNPDILCNRVVKFGVFEEARKAHNAEYIATGHYARVVAKDGRYELHAAYDTSKDQSYFLSGIHADMLPHVLFPLGESVKSDVRKEAHSAGLPTAARRDSQGICFLGKLDMHDFLKHYIEEHEGNVLDEQGEVVGTHRGVQFYTLGERHGFTVTNALLRTKPLYIVNKDVAHNTLTVRETHPHKEAGADFVLSDWNKFVLNLEKYEQCDAVFRYHGERTPVVVKRQDPHRVTITLQKESMLPAQGQTCVLYSGSQVVGGGIIE